MLAPLAISASRVYLWGWIETEGTGLMATEPAADNSGRKKSGPKSLCTPEAIAKAAAAYRLGATDIEVAVELGVAERTIQTWKITKPEFAAVAKLGKEEANDRIEHSLYRRAMGYVGMQTQAIKLKNPDGSERVELVEVPIDVPPSDTAVIFFLKNRRRELWRDQKLLGSDPENPLPGPDTDETVRRVAERMRALKLTDDKGSDLV